MLLSSQSRRLGTENARANASRIEDLPALFLPVSIVIGASSSRASLIALKHLISATPVRLVCLVCCADSIACSLREPKPIYCRRSMLLKL